MATKQEIRETPTLRGSIARIASESKFTNIFVAQSTKLLCLFLQNEKTHIYHPLSTNQLFTFRAWSQTIFLVYRPEERDYGQQYQKGGEE